MSDLKPKKTVLVVDDVPENIDVLSGILCSEYTVKAATNGLRALKIANSDNKPDIILLDIMMPDMSGYEVCKALKECSATRHIPVIFVSAKTETDDTVLGFEAGAVDYMTKPVVPAIVKARVKNILALRENQRRLQVSLDATLTGSIELMIDVLSTASPEAFGRSRNLRRHVRATARRLGHKNHWSFEVAAMLSQLGCISLPSELLERIYNHHPVSLEEQALFDNHPQVGKKLLQKIPNLKYAADIIGLQNAVLDDMEADASIPSDVQLGVSLLQMAVHLDDMERKRNEVEKSKSTGNNQAPKKIAGGLLEQEVSLSELVVGMTIVNDISTRKGMTLIKGGTEVSKAVVERLKGFSDLGNVSGNRFKVRFIEINE
ncbi:MAG: response regulator [Mariprofundaceae bacterium]